MKYFILSILTLFTFESAKSQEATGSVYGKVIDEFTNEPLIGANVILDGTTMGAATDLEGYYSIINVRAGTYTIRFRFLGFKTRVVENIRISADQTTKLDAVLEFTIP